MPVACSSSTKISCPTFDQSTDVDTVETWLKTPAEGSDSDVTNDYSYKASDEEVDSDATRLNTPQSVTEVFSDIKSDSSGSSYIETYISDPTYDGPAYHSQPCNKHGASYTPPGWRKVMIKRRKLEFQDSPSNK